MTWTDGTQTLAINPNNDMSLIKEYKVYGTYTSTSGTPTEFHILTVRIDCVVTSFTKPAAPTGSDLEYILWNVPKIFDYALDWVQVPACGYAVSEAFAWTGDNAYIVKDGGRITISSNKLAAVGTSYAMTL